jgi:hypothetical protein
LISLFEETMPKLIPVADMRRKSGFLRRQEPISPAKERLQDGSLPAQGPDKRAGQFEVPA